MGKKHKFPFLFKAATETTTSSPWPWPTCVNNPKTLSFRADNNDIYKTMNSAYLDKTAIDDEEQEISETREPDSVFSIIDDYLDENLSFPSSRNVEPDIDTVIRDLRSDRLFFEPGETSSILVEPKTDEATLSYKENTVLLAMESSDPCVDFRLSMEEMVEAYGLKNWDCLEELLTCYLKVNSKNNHGYIVGAFVDLLVHLEFVSANSSSSSSSSVATQYSFTSPLSFSSSTNSFTSPCLSSLEHEEEQLAEKNVVVKSQTRSCI